MFDKPFQRIIMTIKPQKNVKSQIKLVAAFVIILCLFTPNYALSSVRAIALEPKISDGEADQYLLIEMVDVEGRKYKFLFDCINISAIDAIEIWTIYSLFNGSQFTAKYIGFGNRDLTAEVWIPPYYPIDLNSLSFTGEVVLYEFYARIFLVDTRYIDSCISFVQVAFINSEITDTTDNMDENEENDTIGTDISSNAEERSTFWKDTGKYFAVILLLLALPGAFIVMQKSQQIPQQEIEEIPSQKIQTQLQHRISKRKRTKRHT